MKHDARTRAIPIAYRSGAGTVLAMLLTATVAAGCSAWRAPPTSPALDAGADCSAMAASAASAAEDRSCVGGTHACKRLHAAVDDARALQKRWDHEARCLVRDTNRGALALVGLSTLALFKAATGLHPKDAAGVGALGAGTYVGSGLSNGELAQRRRLLYAGADVLGCVVRQAEPYLLPVETVKTATHGGTIAEFVAELRKKRQELGEIEAELSADAARVETTTVPGAAAPANCPSTPRACTDGPTRAACEEQKRQCTARSATTRNRRADPRVGEMVERLAQARAEIDRLLEQASDLDARTGMAAFLVERRTAAVARQVAVGYESTFVSGEQLLATLGAMRTKAFNVSRADVFGPAEAKEETPASGKTQNKTSATREVPVQHMQQARNALRAAGIAAAGLREAMLVVQKRVEVLRADGSGCAANRFVVPVTSAAPPDEEAAATPAGDTVPAGVATAEQPREKLGPLLGLRSDATEQEFVAAVRQCQRSVLGRADANGSRLDAETLAAMIDGRCAKAGT